MCPRWVLHHPPPLALDPLHDFVRVQSLRGRGGRDVVRDGLVRRREVLRDRRSRAGQVGGGRGCHRMRRRMRRHLRMESMHGMRDNIIHLGWRLSLGRGVSMRVGAG